jgi:hypothetical protein
LLIVLLYSFPTRNKFHVDIRDFEYRQVWNSGLNSHLSHVRIYMEKYCGCERKFISIFWRFYKLTSLVFTKVWFFECRFCLCVWLYIHVRVYVCMYMPVVSFWTVGWILFIFMYKNISILCAFPVNFYILESKIRVLWLGLKTQNGDFL